MKNKIRCCALALLLLALPGACAAESGTTVKADDLKTEPYRDAKTVAKLKAGEKVDILKRKGGWLQIKTAKGKGWMRMLSVRKGDARKSSGTSASSLSGLASGRSGTGKVVSTTGIRGLNEEELKTAQFNETEVKLAESYLTSCADAQKFAAKGKLKARQMDYLPAPAGGSQ